MFGFSNSLGRSHPVRRLSLVSSIPLNLIFRGSLAEGSHVRLEAGSQEADRLGNHHQAGIQAEDLLGLGILLEAHLGIRVRPHLPPALATQSLFQPASQYPVLTA